MIRLRTSNFNRLATESLITPNYTHSRPSHKDAVLASYRLCGASWQARMSTAIRGCLQLAKS